MKPIQMMELMKENQMANHSLPLEVFQLSSSQSGMVILKKMYHGYENQMKS